MRFLVTGGAGFIGSHLVDALIERGEEVTILDDFSSGKRENIEQALAAGAELLEGSILDGEFVEKAVTEARVDVIVHLAAQGEVRRSIEQPAFDAATNVTGTVNLIDAGRKAGLGRFVLASSGGVIYGEGERIALPAVESAPLEPLCPYGLSKLAGEQYLGLYRRMYMFNSVALRFANVYGPRQNPRGEAGVVAIFGELLLNGKRSVIFGDGTQTRDFVYVGDVVEAILAASVSDLEGAVNIGTGVETGLLDLLDALVDAGEGSNRFESSEVESLEPIFKPRRSGEVRRNAIDPARAAQELGWSAITPLEDGLRRTLEAL